MEAGGCRRQGLEAQEQSVRWGDAKGQPQPHCRRPSHIHRYQDKTNSMYMFLSLASTNLLLYVPSIQVFVHAV